MPESSTILIVDDDRGGREALEALLLTQNYNLVLAASGLEALKKVVEVQPDLILLDVLMPGMDGFEVCRRIRNMPEVAEIPILLLSALSDYRNRLAGLNAGADDYITKPYDSMELFARVRTIVRLNRYRRVQAERAKFLQIFDLSPNGQLTFDQDGKIHLANKAILGLVQADEVKQLTGSTIFDWILEDRRKEFLSFYEDFKKESQSSRRIETWLKTTGTEIRPVEVILGRVDYDGETMTQFIASDIRDRLLTTGALAKERIFVKTLFDAFPDFVYCKDTQSRFTLANKSLTKFLGIASPEDLIGKTDFDLFPKELAMRYLTDEQDLFRNEKSIAGQQERVIDQDGNQHWVITIKVPLRNREGQVVGLIGIGKDITGQKRANSELNESLVKLAKVEQEKQDLERRLDGFSKDLTGFWERMSHMMRTSLNDISGMASLLMENSLTTDQREYVGTIQHSSEQLIVTINNIIDFLNFEAGQLTLVEKSFHIRSCIETVAEEVQSSAVEKGLAFTVTVADDLPPVVLGDPDRLKQVLAHLCRNAIQFTSTGEIFLRADLEEFRPMVLSQTDIPEERYVHFSVSDTGVGIAKANLGRIFKGYHNPKLVRSEETFSAGLGLAVCRHLVEAMGGAIWAESAGEPGMGSVFHFVAHFLLPGNPISNQAIAANKTIARTDRPNQRSPLKLSILLAEDNPVNQKVAMLMLLNLGHQVDAVSDGLAAIQSLERVRYDLVLMDEKMPGMDGTTATRHIRRELSPECQPYIIALTAHTNVEDRDRLLAAGMDGYLSKPVSMATLRKALDGYHPRETGGNVKKPAERTDG